MQQLDGGGGVWVEVALALLIFLENDMSQGEKQHKVTKDRGTRYIGFETESLFHLLMRA